MTKYEPRISKMYREMHSNNLAVKALAHAESCLAEREAEIERLREVYSAAKGLCYGEDWNNGTHAKLHRQRLIDAVNAIELPPAPAMQPETKGE